MYAVFCAPTNFLARAWVMQAVRLAWRAAASLSAAEVLPADTGVGAGAWAVAGGTGGGGAGAARARPLASPERVIKRATAGTERMGEPRVDSPRITVARGCADEATMKLP